MQYFVDGFIAQCKRHKLRAELILVEWNPPKERVPLVDELRWPSDTGPCDVRIITVPTEIHARFEHADKIPLFQMIAKNVGIRRARGRYILATNIDILFSDGIVRFMRDHLRPGMIYRTARLDVPADVPRSDDFADVLQFCNSQAFRIHAHGITVIRRSAEWTKMELLHASLDPRVVNALRLLGLSARKLKLLAHPKDFARALTRFALGVDPHSPLPTFTSGKLTFRLFRYICAGVSRRLMRSMPGLIRSLTTKLPFTNACGDFTLLSRPDWFRLRGYVEWRTFSWHLDSLLIYQAVGAGLKERRLNGSQRIFHIEHGNGYTPEAAAELFSRLAHQGIPFLRYADLERLRLEISMKPHVEPGLHVNDESWGLADVPLPEAVPTRKTALGRTASDTKARAVL